MASATGASDPLEFVLGDSKGQAMRRDMDEGGQGPAAEGAGAEAESGFVTKQAFERLKHELVQVRGMCTRLQTIVKTLEAKVHRR